MMTILSVELADENLEGLWRQILDVFKGGLLADWYGLSEGYGI